VNKLLDPVELFLKFRFGVKIPGHGAILLRFLLALLYPGRKETTRALVEK
jgi:hypothetical protein